MKRPEHRLHHYIVEIVETDAGHIAEMRAGPFSTLAEAVEAGDRWISWTIYADELEAENEELRAQKVAADTVAQEALASAAVPKPLTDIEIAGLGREKLIRQLYAAILDRNRYFEMKQVNAELYAQERALRQELEVKLRELEVG